MSYYISNRLSFEKDDLLHRDISVKEVETIVNTMRSCKRYPTSISIALDSRWGSGKTYFLSMWKNYLSKPENIDRVVYYNAWEYDDCDSTLLPLVASIINDTTSINEDAQAAVQQNERDKDLIEYAKIVLKVVVSSSLKMASNKILGDNESLVDIVNDSIDEIKKDAKNMERMFEKFNQYYKCRNSLNEAFKILIPQNGKLWIFIDDLDRCKPEFALKTLEDIKHFFDLEDVIFIFSIDIKQLIDSVKKTYGLTENADSYIRKFFDYIYMLPSPNLAEYIQETFKQDQKDLLPDYLIDYIIELYDTFDYSLREINQNISHLYIFLEKYKERIKKINDENSHQPELGPTSRIGERNDSLKVYLFFLIVRDKFNRTYLDIIRGKFSFEKTETNKYYVIDEKFKGDPIIDSVLQLLCDGGAMLPGPLSNVIEKNQLFCDIIPSSFEKHMENVLG